jgi:hypothetical protein
LAAREKDCFENHRTTAAQVTGQQNWIFVLKTLFSQKLSN